MLVLGQFPRSSSSSQKVMATKRIKIIAQDKWRFEEISAVWTQPNLLQLKKNRKNWLIFLLILKFQKLNKIKIFFLSNDKMSNLILKSFNFNWHCVIWRKNPCFTFDTYFVLTFVFVAYSVVTRTLWMTRARSQLILEKEFVDLFPLRRISTDWTNSERPQTHKTTDVVAQHIEARAKKIVHNTKLLFFRLFSKCI